LIGKKLKSVKVRDLILLIETDGWKAWRTTGSHRHFKHGTKANVVTGPDNPGDDIPIGTLKAKVWIGVAAAYRARQKLVAVRVIQEDAAPKPDSGFTLVFSQWPVAGNGGQLRHPRHWRD